MSLPYRYVDYSTPNTPSVYTWAVGQETPQHQREQNTSNILSPARQDPSPLHRANHPLPNAYQQSSTIQLQEQGASQYYRFIDDAPAVQTGPLSESTSEMHKLDTEHGRGSLLLDPMRPSTSPTDLARAGQSSLAMRAPPSRVHAQAAHPYKRPQSVANDAMRLRRESEIQQMRDAASNFAVPAVGSAMSVSCPAARTWKAAHQRATSAVNAPAAASPESARSYDAQTSSPTSPRTETAALTTKQFSIRTDVHYDAGENMLVAMFELPGLKKRDLQMIMSVCPYSRVRQVTISGRSHPAFPEAGYTVRERKFGAFTRTLVVPPNTKADDVVAVMEDGILTLRIPGGAPAAGEKPQSIALQ